MALRIASLSTRDRPRSASISTKTRTSYLGVRSIEISIHITLTRDHLGAPAVLRVYQDGALVCEVVLTSQELEGLIRQVLKAYFFQ